MKQLTRATRKEEEIPWRRERERELELLEVGDHALGTRKENFIASRVRRQKWVEQEPKCLRNSEGWLLESCFARDQVEGE